jgi:hypothetical protein
VPIVILEGCDGAGKTTLAEEIQDVWFRIKQPEDNRIPQVTTIHFGPPDPITSDETLEMYGARLRKRLLRDIEAFDHTDSTKLLIVDRLHIGSYVYGNLFRPETSVGGWGELGRDGLSYVDDAYAAKGAVMAILLPDAGTLVRRSASRVDEFLDSVSLSVPGDSNAASERARQLVEIATAYEVFVRMYGSDYATYRRIGHPYYTDPERNPGYPDIAYETDVKLVAADIVGRAIDASLDVARNEADILDPDGSIRRAIAEDRLKMEKE